MSPPQKKAYAEMLASYRAELDAGTITAVNEGVRVSKLAQIAAGAAYDRSGETHEIDCKPKLDALMELLAETTDRQGRQGKAIVFTSFKHSTELLRRTIAKRYTVAVVNGDVPKAQRSEIFGAFQKDELQVIVAHPQVAAHGLTLTAANTEIWFSPIWSHRIYEQATARIVRASQERKQLIVQLSCAPVEEKMYRKLDTKEKMQGLLLELMEGGK
jgi:SNF2 family DNA or RNA helicase